jgi:putative transcriptional regulator
MNSNYSPDSLKDHFLIAMPALTEGPFAHSLTYICEHTEHGAMGIVINHPMDIQLEEILEQLHIDHDRHDHQQPVLAGGPVQMDRGFILHSGDQHWSSTLAITDSVSLTTSQDILKAIAHHDGPNDQLVALGYAGWSAGQLEQELANNAWLTVPADSDIIFNIPASQRLQAATDKLGIDLNLLAPDAGHA